MFIFHFAVEHFDKMNRFDTDAREETREEARPVLASVTTPTVFYPDVVEAAATGIMNME